MATSQGFQGPPPGPWQAQTGAYYGSSYTPSASSTQSNIGPGAGQMAVAAQAQANQRAANLQPGQWYDANGQIQSGPWSSASWDADPAGYAAQGIYVPSQQKSTGPGFQTQSPGQSGQTQTPGTPGTASYNNPYTYGLTQPPGAVQTQWGGTYIPGQPMTAAQAVSQGNQVRSNLNQLDAQNTVNLGRTASAAIADQMNQYQQAVQNQGIANSQLAAGQYASQLQNLLTNQNLASQLWQGNVGLQNQYLNSLGYQIPTLTNLLGA